MITMRTRALAVAAVSAAALIAIAGPAHADHGGDSNTPGPDNLQQAVKGQNLSERGKAATAHGKAQLERSKISVSTGGGDIYVKDDHYGQTGWTGSTYCTDVGWDGKCNESLVRFNATYMADEPVDQWKSLGCHELGHTGTLGDRGPGNDSNDNSCMRDDIWPKRFDTHDINAINEHA